MRRRALTIGILISATAVPLIAFGQYSLAQSAEEAVATTTDESVFASIISDTLATSSDETIATSSVQLSDASTTSSASDESVKADTDIAQAEAIDKIAEETVDTGEIDKIIQSIADLQSAYFEKNGKYLQVMEKRQLPEYESGDLKEKIGSILPSTVSVNVYEGPKGKGFQVVFRNKLIVKAVGFGPEAESLTYTNETPVVDASVASTTATTTASIDIATSTETTGDNTSDQSTSTTDATPADIQTASSTFEIWTSTDTSSSSTSTDENIIDLSPTATTSTDQSIL